METNRILSITIHNIKNVKNGTLDFCENENVKNGIFCNNAGILGLYGQNPDFRIYPKNKVLQINQMRHW